MISTMRFSIIAFFTLCKMFCEVISEECKQSDYSILGMMLQGHTFKKLNTSISFECLQACNDDFRCHSFHYVISRRVCELNNRTKEARPENFIPNSERYYFRPNKKTVPIGSIPEFPAETCREIKASEEGQAVSGKYWFDSIIPGKTILVPCNMETEDADECSASLPVCDVNATCQNTLRSYLCICESGLTGNGKTCYDFDECNAVNPVCDVNANCQNTYRSYVCSCKVGFTGDGKTCNDVDECSAAAGVCDANANCQNTDGSYGCSCKPGFTGDGKTCTDLDECGAADGVCDANADCQNTDGSYSCSCKPGFAGDGKACIDTACSVEPVDRVRCPAAYGGITREECESNGCCFDDSISNTIWCFTRQAVVCAAVGVEDSNQISDAKMTASSVYSSYYAYKGRLNGETGWCQGTSTISNDYIQVDMGAVRTVCAVATQGKKNGSYVTSYKLSLSTDGVSWNTYREGNTDKIFQANTDLNTIVQHTLQNAAQARYVRFYPVTKSNFPCMRVEVFVQ